MMDIKHIHEILVRIEELKDCDPEAATSERDSMYVNVLQEIAKGREQGRGPYPGKDYDDDVDLAKEALKAELIKLRWEARA